MKYLSWTGFLIANQALVIDNRILIGADLLILINKYRASSACPMTVRESLISLGTSNPKADGRARAARRVVQIQCQDTSIAAKVPTATAEEATQPRLSSVTV